MTKNHNKNYQSPLVREIELDSEGVLCESGNAELGGYSRNEDAWEW
ncbi:MAG: hypothetical protein II194_04895 [Bacteroidales bacterium]|nr:hypothetical protein [Bacteroidales bacterium]